MGHRDRRSILFRRRTVHFRSAVSGDIVEFTWEDSAWGEFKHEIAARYLLDSEDDTAPWIQFSTEDQIGGVGRHRDIADSSFVYSVSVPLTEHRERRGNQVLPEYTSYKVCGRAYFNQFGTYSSMKCSFPVRVSNAEHNALTLREGRINYDDTDIRYGETLSVTVSDLVPNDLTAFALRLDPIFAGGNTDCTGHAATGPHDIPLSGTTTLVKGCDSGRGYIKLVSGMRVVSTGRLIRVDSSPRDLSATVNGTTVSLSWTRSPDPDFSAQHVERMQNGGARQFRVSSTASSYRDENVPYGTHTYKILVLDSAGRAETSNLVQVTLSPPVPTPTNTSIPATATKTPRPTATQPPLTVEPTVTKTPTPRPVSTQPPLTVEPTVTKTPTRDRLRRNHRLQSSRRRTKHL